jgi:tetratricopeptide (TPR) repeat protein
MNQLLRWFNWFNRERLSLLIGSGLLALGAVSPWYRLPTEVLDTFGINFAWSNAARLFSLWLALFGLAFTFLLSIKQAPRLLIWSALIAALLFPSFMVTWMPEVNFIAKAYYEQADAVSDHVTENFPEVQAQWKQNILLAPTRPTTSVFEFNIKDSRFFQMASWDYLLLEGMGYTNSFFQYIGKGWGFTVSGIVILLFALYLGIETDGLNVFVKDMGKFLPGLGLVMGLIVCGLISVNIINYNIDTAFAKGEYGKVVATSKNLAAWYPPLAGDEAFLQRLAAAGFYSNQPDVALIDFAKGLERYRVQDFPKAESYFKQSLAIQPKRFLVRGYLASAMLNQGINYFNDPNGRKSEAAASIFAAVLQIFPGNLEALYDLMLARAVNGDYQNSALVAQQIIDVQKYAQQPRFGLLGQAYVHLTWDSYHQKDLEAAWKRYRQSVDTSAWKEPITEGEK